MDFPLKNCIVAEQLFSLTRVKELLQYPQLLEYVLIDLQMLEEETNRLGKEKVLAHNLAKEEQDLLSTFTLPKRKKEWLGGRFAAKYVASRLLEQVENQIHGMHWTQYVIIADKNGRPYLAANNKSTTCMPMPDISISHSGSMAAGMASPKGFCGIDIQIVTPKVFKVSDRFCTHNEKKILENFFPGEPEKQDFPLTELWAAKEALRKASCMSSLPGFLEMELLEITSAPLEKKTGPWGFIFTWKNPAGNTHEKYLVAVAQIGDYALALTARDDTVD